MYPYPSSDLNSSRLASGFASLTSDNLEYIASNTATVASSTGYGGTITITITNNPSNNSVTINIDGYIDMIFDDYFSGITELYLICVSYTYDTQQFIHSITFEKELIPMIDFKASIGAAEDILQQFSAVYDDSEIPLLIPSAFNTQIRLFMNNSNDSYKANTWHVKLGATFDNCFDYDETDSNFRPGYTKLIVYTFNETFGDRSELFNLSLLQVKCPGTIEVKFDWPTNYDPTNYFTNCSQIYYNLTTNYTVTSDNGTNITVSNVTLVNETYCFSNELITASPFMIEWSDNAFSYLLYTTYIYGNYNYSAGIDYFTPWEVFDPSQALLWLLQEDELGVTILLLVFPFCSLIFSIMMCTLNVQYCRKPKNHCLALDVFVLDATKLRQNALIHVQKYHFTPNSQFIDETVRQSSDEQKKATYFEKACNQAFVTVATVTTFVYGLALLEKIALLQDWDYFDNTYWYLFSSYRERWDSFFYPTFIYAFIALSFSLLIWSVCCLGTCYLIDRSSGRLEGQQNEMIAAQISQDAQDREEMQLAWETAKQTITNRKGTDARDNGTQIVFAPTTPDFGARKNKKNDMPESTQLERNMSIELVASENRSDIGTKQMQNNGANIAGGNNKDPDDEKQGYSIEYNEKYIGWKHGPFIVCQLTCLI